MRETVLISVLFLSSAAAWSDNNDVEAFENAWQEYVAAEELDDANLRVETAARAVDAARRLFAASDERLALVMHNYGVALSDNGDREQAVTVLEETLKLGETYYGDDGIGLVPILADLADARAKSSSPTAQLRQYRRALEIVVQTFGRQSVEYADLAFRSSRNIYTMSRSTAAQEYMSDAREIYLSLLEPKTQSAALADYYLGKMEFSGRDYRRSSEYLERALAGLHGPGDANQALRLLTRGLLVRVYERRGLSDQATPHCIAIGREGQLLPTQDIAPLARVTPTYPFSMLHARKEGKLDIEFTVDVNGFVRDPVIVSRTVDGRETRFKSDFDQAALDAVNKFRYAPRFVDGEPVASTGVTTQIEFSWKQTRGGRHRQTAIGTVDVE